MPVEIQIAEVVDSLAQRYGKLPSEIMEADSSNWLTSKLADLGAWARAGKE